MLDIEKAVYSGIIGFCVGDALGVPVEFKKREELKLNPVKEMLSDGSHGRLQGTWSDDSSLTFCTMESLCSGINYEDLMKKFIKWLEEGYYTPTGTSFDVGRTTFKAIVNSLKGIEALECGQKSEYDNGNGALMRILPISYYLLYNNIQGVEKYNIISNVTKLTHAHIRNEIGCTFYVLNVINLLKGMDKKEAYLETINEIEEIYSEFKYTELNNYIRLLNKNIMNYTEENIKSTGYIIDTLESVEWCFLTTNSYEEAVFKAINLGDDTDTIGALTGAISGIYYGYNAIPNNFVNTLLKKKEIFDLCDRYIASLNKVGNIDG